MIYITYPKIKQGFDFHIAIVIPSKDISILTFQKNLPRLLINQQEFGMIIKHGEAKTSKLPSNNPSIKNGIVSLSLEDKIKKSRMFPYTLITLAQHISNHYEADVLSIHSQLLDICTRPLYQNLDYISKMYPRLLQKMKESFNPQNSNQNISEFVNFLIYLRQNGKLKLLSLRYVEMKYLWDIISQQEESNKPNLETGKCPRKKFHHSLKLAFSKKMKELRDGTEQEDKQVWEFIKDRRFRPKGNFEDFISSIIGTYPSVRTTEGLKNIKHMIELISAIRGTSENSSPTIDAKFVYNSEEYMVRIPKQDGDPSGSFANYLIKTNHYWVLRASKISSGIPYNFKLPINNSTITQLMASLQFEKLILNLKLYHLDIYSGDIRVPTKKQPYSDAPANNDLGRTHIFSRFSASTRSRNGKVKRYLKDPFLENPSKWSQAIEDWLHLKCDYSKLDIEAYKSLFVGSPNSKLKDIVIKHANRSKLPPGLDVKKIASKLSKKIRDGKNYNYITEALDIIKDHLPDFGEDELRSYLAEKLETVFSGIYAKFRSSLV